MCTSLILAGKEGVERARICGVVMSEERMRWRAVAARAGRGAAREDDEAMIDERNCG